MIPEDYKNPDWNSMDRVHEWKRYIHTNQLMMAWPLLPGWIKELIAENAYEQALTEEWE